ncbi:AGAP008221-PA, partial [Anopheles gambiae str. PEST]
LLFSHFHFHASHAPRIRTKHVSFARSYTLTSFDEAMGSRPLSRLAAARSQERLIGGKKPTITLAQHAAGPYATGAPLHSILTQPTAQPQPLLPQALQKQPLSQHYPPPLGPVKWHQTTPCSPGTLGAQPTQNILPCCSQEKLKKSSPHQPRKTTACSHNNNYGWKTKATKLQMWLPLQVKMVSQGAQTNGGLNGGGRKLTKSLSEAGDRLQENGIDPNVLQPVDTGTANANFDHELLHRTQSEEPPKSPFTITSPPATHVGPHFELPSSRTSSQLSHSDGTHLTHSRNHSQDSATSYRSTDGSRTSYETASYPYDALPRRTCIHHKPEEFHTHTLPRRDHGHAHHHHDIVYRDQSHPALPAPEHLILSNGSVNQDVRSFDSMPTATALNRRMSAHAITQPFQPLVKPQPPTLTSHYTSQTAPPSCPVTPPNIQPLDMQDDTKSSSEGSCSTCDSDSEQELDGMPGEEREIFIDFKPRVSPVPSPGAVKKKKLQKAQSEGELMHADARRKASVTADGDGGSSTVPTGSDDEGRSTMREQCAAPKLPKPDYRDASESSVPDDEPQVKDRRKESFRKRSVSLDQPTSCEQEDEEEREHNGTQRMSSRSRSIGAAIGSRHLSAPPSPQKEDHSASTGRLHREASPFHSSDSLANDATRDTSDGNWNESQATIMTKGDCISSDSLTDNGKLTPSSRRKNLLLQHQQRSSMDTDVLDMEDIADQVGAETPKVMQSLYPTSSMPSGSPATPQQPSPSSAKLPHHHPIGAATPVAARFAKSSPGNGVDLLKDHPVFSQDPSTSGPGGATGGGAGSEGSTTEDYVTCTDNSKRGASGAKGTYKTIHATRPTKQVPGSKCPILTHSHALFDGSSFESASSIYSLARVDAVCEETPPVEEKSVSPQIPPPPIPKPSPTHSVSSSSSDSFSVSKKCSPSRAALPKAIAGKVKPAKPQSLSDDERSEKRYSSSHDEKEAAPKLPYAGAATGTIARSARRGRDWNEEERRRKKSTFKLEFDKDSIKTYTTPMLRQPSPGFKKLSPEDKSALNVLDGASPSSKQKRFRPKTRKSPRARSAVPEDTTAGSGMGSTGTLPRRSKTPLVRSPEKPTVVAAAAATATTAVVMATPQPTIVTTGTKLSPSQYYSQIRSPPSVGSPRKQKISPEKRLQAISTESLRSVSPGSDSVFYSEADALSHCEHQVHCSHCGKEVEVSNLPGESEESILTLDSTDNDRPDIVQPPEGFADSPDCTKTPHHTRLYKKMDKRFRSEDRHVDRRHFKSRQEYRAKSEERGKEEIEPNNLRPAGSSPCVAPAGQAYIDTTSEPEQGIYHGNYKAGLWICIADRDVWRRNELPDGSFDRPKDATLERRGSTDSERDFRKKYQAITHRLVHRKSCVEMYRRQNSNSFGKIAFKAILHGRSLMRSLRLLSTDTDKTVVVCRKSGEFGFRIHGSKPVVVSAIEPDTPAETSGLEVGDIVLSVNGISVIDKSHSEVVKIAHAGSDTLELEVARTIGMLSPLDDGSSHPSIYTGFLWRYCSSGGKWVRRWFSLRPDHCLYYYKSDADNQPIGAIMLTNHTIERIPLEPITRPHSFAIDTEEGTKVQLSADTEEAASRWIAIISHAAQQCDPWLENSARNLRLCATGISKPDCSGPLTKLGSKWRSWTKRYCVLKDAVLYFYHDGTSKSAFGMACLQGYRVQPSSAGGKKYAFEIVPPELSLRHYYFHTETEMDKKR